MITLQFSRSTELVSLLIAHAVRGQFSHCDIVLPDGNLLGASNSPHAPVISGNPGGVAIRPPDYQPFAIRRQAKLLCSEKVEANFIEKAMSQLGEPFDESAMHAVFSDVPDFGRDWRDGSAWFCTEHIAWSLEEAGFFMYQLLISKGRVTPSDLLLIINPWIINTDTFWDPIPGLKLGPKEI